MTKRQRKKLSGSGDDLVQLRRCTSPGEPLRWLADAFEKAPFDQHVCDLGGGPEIIVPANEPGIIEDLRAAADLADGHSRN